MGDGIKKEEFTTLVFDRKREVHFTK